MNEWIITSEKPNEKLTEKSFDSSISSITNHVDKPMLCWIYKAAFIIFISCSLKKYENGYDIITIGIIRIDVVIDAGKKINIEKKGLSFNLFDSPICLL